jgi:hypothetical protein
MTDHKEPIFDVAQLAHVEILTPKLNDTLWFFKDLLGLEERVCLNLGALGSEGMLVR